MLKEADVRSYELIASGDYAGRGSLCVSGCLTACPHAGAVDTFGHFGAVAGSRHAAFLAHFALLSHDDLAADRATLPINVADRYRLVCRVAPFRGSSRGERRSRSSPCRRG